MVGIKSNKRIIYADTNFDIQFSDGYSNLLKLKDQGFYFFNFSYKQEVGYTVFQFNSNYPYINTQMQMLMPLRYISSKKEFENLFHSKNKQKAIEDFWVEISGSKERAKNMIKLYYNRVQNANIYFTSDKEGWMTDRGMIYIIYGAPDVVYRNKSMETWKYGDHKSSSNSITFDFYKANNPFTDNDYNMSRSTAYGPSWNRAIEIWRR
jgi:GWxTD domain-containing protein